MNKLLLASLSCFLLLANGDFQLGKDDSQSEQPQFPGSSPLQRRTEEHEREKRMPPGQKLDSFGYAWNIGSGVSYMKMHVGKDLYGGSAERLRSAQSQVEHSLQESDHDAQKQKVETGKIGVGNTDNVLNGNLKTVKPTIEVMGLLKRNRLNVNEEDRSKTSQHENVGLVGNKYGLKGNNFGAHSFMTSNEEDDKKHTDISVHLRSDGEYKKGRLDGYVNNIRISEGTTGSVTTPNFELKGDSSIPHKFYLNNEKNNAKVLAGDDSGKGDIGQTGIDKSGSVMYQTGAFDTQSSDSKRISQELDAFDSSYKSGKGEDIGGSYRFNGEQTYDVGRSFRGDLYNYRPWISQLDNQGFSFKGLNLGEHSFILTNAGKSAHEPITSELNYGEQYHGIGHVNGAEFKDTDLRDGKKVNEDEGKVNNAHFPEEILKGYSLGLLQSISNLGGDHQSKLNFGDTTWNIASTPKDVQRKIHSSYRVTETGENNNYANEENTGGENGEDDTTRSKNNEGNTDEGIPELPVDFGKHESKFLANESKEKKPFLMKLSNEHIVGVNNGMNPLGRISYNAFSFGNDHPFTKKLIAEQAEQIKLVQDNNYRSAVDGSMVGANVYDILDGNHQGDLSEPEYNFQVPSVDSQRNTNYYTHEVGSNNGFTKGIIGLKNDSMKHDTEENNFDTKSWIKDSNVEGEQDGASKNNIENGLPTSVSYSNIRLGHSLGRPNGLEPFLTGHEFSSMFLRNHSLGERSLSSENISTEFSGSKDEDDKRKALWRKERFSGQYSTERRPILMNGVGEVASTKRIVEKKLKTKIQTFSKEEKQRDERKGIELKSAEDLNHQVEENVSNKEAIGNEDIDHLASSTIAKHNFESDNGDEHNHWEGSVGEEHEVGEIKHRVNGNFGQLSFLFHKEPEVKEITKAIPVHKELKIPVPQMVRHPILIPVPFKVLEPYPIKIPVPVAVEKTVEVPVEKLIPYPVEKPVPMKVIKKVRVPVPKPYPVKVPVYKIKYIHHNKKKHH